MQKSRPGQEPERAEHKRAHARPIVKWAGGKRWLVPLLCDAVDRHLARTGGRYVEPFLGSGAVALDLGFPDMILGDACRPLIEMYEAVRRKPKDVVWALQALVAKGTDRQAYLEVRSARYPSPILAAARFIYLNKYGFNGLYRENRNGGFNVPYGGVRKNGVLPTSEEIEAVAAALASSDLRVRDFRDTLADAREGDLLYVDSPYLGTYSDYTAGGFTEADHVDLAERLREVANSGVTVIATNADNERVRELYAWAHVVSVTERRSIGATAARRGTVPAVVILSDPAFLPCFEGVRPDHANGGAGATKRF